MAMFKMTCDQGHEPMSWTTDAADKDAAYEAFMAMPEVMEHVSSMHADMASMGDDEKKDMVMGMISEEGDDMGGDMDKDMSDDTMAAGADQDMGASDDAAQM